MTCTNQFDWTLFTTSLDWFETPKPLPIKVHYQQKKLKEFWSDVTLTTDVLGTKVIEKGIPSSSRCRRVVCHILLHHHKLHDR